MKQKIKIVIGANFGDEGKGLITDFFSYCLPTLVVMSNGGAQRGHTVDTADGKHHVFKHFGSGTFNGADTYFSEYFILNPMTFRKEYEEIKYFFNKDLFPKLYFHQNCRWTTPFDILVNQIVEEERDNNRHGSCGMGIWETVYRYENSFDIQKIYNFLFMTYDQKVMFLKNLRDNYYINRLKEYGISSVPNSWKDIFYSDVLITNFISDVEFFLAKCSPTTDEVIKTYPNVVFENGQGLLLDMDMTFYGDNTTPTKTGVENIIKILKRTYTDSELHSLDIEVCYVSRTYITRHGAGRFLTECRKEILNNNNMFDETNVNNEFQGSLRYGELIVDSLCERIRFNSDKLISSVNSNNILVSLAFTHTNEVKPQIDKLHGNLFGKIYVSDGKTADTIKILK